MAGHDANSVLLGLAFHGKAQGADYRGIGVHAVALSRGQTHVHRQVVSETPFRFSLFMAFEGARRPVRIGSGRDILIITWSYYVAFLFLSSSARIAAPMVSMKKGFLM
jgi:hypothetical protein